MFGFNTVSLDAKGRLSIPARYRDDFKSHNQSKIVVTKDPQYPSLKIYSGVEWKKISTKLQSLQGLDPIVRNIQWTILGNAHQTNIDINGRMLIRNVVWARDRGCQEFVYSPPSPQRPARPSSGRLARARAHLARLRTR